MYRRNKDEAMSQALNFGKAIFR